MGEDIRLYFYSGQAILSKPNNKKLHKFHSVTEAMNCIKEIKGHKRFRSVRQFVLIKYNKAFDSNIIKLVQNETNT